MNRRSVRVQAPFLSWVVGVLVLGVVVVLGFFFFTFVLVGLAVAVVLAPLLAWWRRKRLPRTPGRGKVIDAEYTVSPNKAEE
ncbi:MAG: hypothetical protein ACYSUN_11855 [Planctomycetota bacterium]|jgi:phosphotransferase system  glucose/maltose/N-acetylglucosamine-specific IIC component